MSPIAHVNQNVFSKEDKVMNPEQFERVMTAILEGKYSWACVLILRFAGYNPAHYIPYRTYKRLIKSNRASSTAETTVTNTAPAPASPTSAPVNPADSHRFAPVAGRG